MRKPLTITLPEELIQAIKAMAEKEHRNVSNMAEVLFRKAVGKQVATNRATKFVKPTLQELIEAFNGRVIDPRGEAETFLNHYNSNGWKIGGKAPMKSWQSAVANWIKRGKENGQRKQVSNQSLSRADETRAAIDGLFGASPDGVIEGDYEQVG